MLCVRGSLYKRVSFFLFINEKNYTKVKTSYPYLFHNILLRSHDRANQLKNEALYLKKIINHICWDSHSTVIFTGLSDGGALAIIGVEFEYGTWDGISRCCCCCCCCNDNCSRLLDFTNNLSLFLQHITNPVATPAT